MWNSNILINVCKLNSLTELQYNATIKPNMYLETVGYMYENYYDFIRV